MIILFVGLMFSLVWADAPQDRDFSTVTAVGVTLNYRVIDDGLNLDCQLIAATTGWVAVGFAPTVQMQNANFIIGYHQSGNTFIRDDYGTSTTTHASDTSLGGMNNIIVSSSSEVAGVTQLNFKIPLNSGDPYDRILVIGNTYNIILARGFNGGDSFTSSHAARAGAQITIPQITSVQDEVLPIPDFPINSFPNPFSSETRITLQFKSDAVLSADIYNIRGQLVKSYPNLQLKQGENQLVWDGRDNRGKALPDGIYFFSAETSGQQRTHRLLLLRK